jgi:hypothetical protein
VNLEFQLAVAYAMIDILRRGSGPRTRGTEG